MFQELVGRPGDDKVIGKADEVDLWTGLRALLPDVAWKGLPQAGFQAVQDQIRNDGCAYTSYKVANMLVEFSTSIPRTQLRPGYGDGFLGAPLQLRQALDNPTAREQGEQRGSSPTPSQQNSGGAPYM